MRSYLLSLSLVAGLLLGYTAIVLNSHSTSPKAATATTPEHREPAAQAATTDDSASAVN